MLLRESLYTVVMKDNLELQMVGMRGGGEKWQWTGPEPVTSRSIADPMHAAKSLVNGQQPLIHSP